MKEGESLDNQKWIKSSKVAYKCKTPNGKIFASLTGCAEDINNNKEWVLDASR